MKKEIKGTEGKYFIFDDGRCFSLKSNKFIKQRTIGKSIKNKGWKPYQQYMIYYKDGPRAKMIHRLVAEAFIPNPKRKPEVNHKDNNPLNNSVENLEWVTSSENAKHGIQFNEPHYRSFGKRMTKYLKKGEEHPNSKLKDREVIEIRKKYKTNNYSLSNLANMYNVSKN